MLESIVEGINKRLEEGIRVELFDGRCIGDGKHTIRVLKERVIGEVMRDPEMGFCEAYMRGDIQIEGDLEKVLIACMGYMSDRKGKREILSYLIRLFLGALRLIKGLEGREVRKHYDLGNDFYRLWLDGSMTYSCAFFSEPSASLEEAQREKRRIIYEKLQIQKGDRLLDIGCGWGSIVLESALEYGTYSTGITLSRNQYEYVREKIKELGLEGRAEVYLMHYEDLPKIGKTFNKVVSVGMFEHVGKGRHRRFFEIVSKVMEKGGLFLLHTIGKVHPSTQSRWIREVIYLQ